MKKIKLGKEEKEISVAIDREEFVPVTGKQLEEVVSSIKSWKAKQN